MYPAGYLTYVEVERITDILCGKSRPKHFRGVTTVVTKLLNIVRPDVLYLGQKDAQQAVVLKRMSKDLNLPVKIRVMPIVREPDGLAMSSRNAYLNERQRQETKVLYESLKKARRIIRQGEHETVKIVRKIKKHIRENSSGKIDYVACVDADTLKTHERISSRTLISLAVHFGKTRLIDNIIVRTS